jgi:hypothetical protein
VDSRGDGVTGQGGDGVRRFLRFCRHSFWFRAALTLALGTMMSCGNCTTCLAFATYIGCNACGDSSTGCGTGDDDDEEEEELPETEVFCQDGVDDDGDGAADCDDSDCRFAGLCGEYICYDGVDDDGDGATDCDDDDCCHLRQCRCRCETRCEAGTTLCVADEETCEAQCCPAGETCVEGRCAACATECAAGYGPCWTGEGPCGHVCCTPGQGCGSGVCGCETACGAGTRACLVDEWTCEHDCCADGEICRSGGCTPYGCSDVVAVEGAAYDFDLAWADLEDTVDVGGLDGCGESAGAEALIEIEVPPGQAVSVQLDSGRLAGAHVLDACPPDACRASVSDVPRQALLWLNAGDEPERALVLLEGYGSAARGRVEVSGFTGDACAAALGVELAAGAYGWTGDASLFAGADESGLCDTGAQLRVWFEVEVAAGERLDAAVRGTGAGLAPSVVIAGGECAAPQCLAVGGETAWYRNAGETAASVLVAVGFAPEYDGALFVELQTE